jgi:phosphoribosylamine--glycine ligase
MHERIMEQVLRPTVAGLAAEGIDYQGFLYAGLMVTAKGLKVLEFNVRFGDPETQAVLPRLQSDLFELFLAAEQGRLAEVSMEWTDDHAACVVMASGGYPGSYDKGHVITGIDDAEAAGAYVFHAGTDSADGATVTAGGRVLGVVGLGQTLRDAVDVAYSGAGRISWTGAYYRRDIGHRAL